MREQLKTEAPTSKRGKNIENETNDLKAGPKIEPDEVRRHLALLGGVWREVSMLHPMPQSVAVGHSPQHVASLVVKADADNVPGWYVTVNEVDEAAGQKRYGFGLVPSVQHGRAATSFTVSKRTGILIDVDAGQGKTADGKPRMANGAERANARQLADEVRCLLASLCWPDPIVVDSGNGVQLLYRCDLPADDEGLTEHLLHAVKAATGAHGTADVDTGTFDPPRLARLAGTINRKGTNDVEGGRPWRRTAILHDPGTLELVSADLLRTTVAALDPDGTAKPTKPVKAFDGEPYVGSEDAAGKVLTAVVGALNAHGIDVAGDTPKGLELSRCPWCDNGPENGSAGPPMIFHGEGERLGYHCFHDSERDDPEWAVEREAKPTPCHARNWHDLRRITIGSKAKRDAADLPLDPLAIDVAKMVTPFPAADEAAAGNEATNEGENAPDDEADEKPTADEGTAEDVPNDEETAEDAENRSAQTDKTGGFAADEGSKSSSVQNERPVIPVNGEHARDTYAKAFGALAAANDPVHLVNFGGALCKIDRKHGGAVAKPMSKGGVLLTLAKAADWVSVRKAAKGKAVDEPGFVLTPTKPPMDVVDVVRERPDGLPELDGITTTPVLLPGGRLLTSPGYDEGSGLYLDGDGFGDLNVPDQPSPDEVQAAAALLDEVVADFPFATDADRTNFHALLLTPFLRPMIDGPTPLYCIDATTAGSGKTLLANAWAGIVTGSPLPTKTAPRSNDEWGKRLGSALLAAPPVVFWDNVATTIQSAELAAALTAPVHSCRILGASKEADVPVSCVWLCTGNGLQLSDEIRRRSVLIRLDADCEDPAERAVNYRHADLLGWIRENRAELLRACLTLCRAGLSLLASDSPPIPPKMGRYESWATLVHAALVAMNRHDLIGNRNELRERDAGTNEVAAFVELWAALPAEDEGRTAGDLASSLLADDEVLGDTLRPDKRNGVGLGYWLRRNRGKVVGDRKIVSGDKGMHGVRWRLLPVNG